MNALRSRFPLNSPLGEENMKAILMRYMFLSIALVFLVSCGGGGGGSHDSIKGNYFPYAQGNRWGYQALRTENGNPQNAYQEFLR